MDRVFIIHGWDSHPSEGCFPWLKSELDKESFEVIAPAMPDPLHPRIETWVAFLAEQVGTPDEHTFFVGHSIGCQTILRYLETLPANTKIGGAVLLAPWIHLTDEACEDAEDFEIAKPWLETPLQWDTIKSHSNTFIAIFSDDDPLVPLTDSKIFEEKLGTRTIIEQSKEHFSGSSGITELSSLLSAVIELRQQG
ncbi:MAG: alpha/beta hydrolase [Candidatus Pacebacteria bacterium]|nr:alpha/beta hydrolase [Candidatus Paceibacterota bacterium]